jgi:hypothetical protein
LRPTWSPPRTRFRYRYEREAKPELPGGDPALVEAVSAHLDAGVEALFDPFDQAEITELLDPPRPSVLA